MDRPLNSMARWAVSAHRLICARSRRLNSQMLTMNEAFTKSGAFDLNKGSIVGLSMDGKSLILGAVAEASDDS